MAGLPDIDALFLEWRWPITGRNTTMCGASGHTCDLHRQDELVSHYTIGRCTPTILWDKDRMLAPSAHIRMVRNVVVCEAALMPAQGATRLMFPLRDDLIDSADPTQLAAADRDLVLAYVGNQYGRDEEFDEYFVPAARRYRHVIAGKWTHTSRWPDLNFIGRVAFEAGTSIYRRSIATVLLLPQRYARVGQMTQRLFEATLAGCLPLAMSSTVGAELYVPTELHVRTGDEVIGVVSRLREIAGSADHARLIAECIGRLQIFSLETQLNQIDAILNKP
jgi:hypothetical protein